MAKNPEPKLGLYLAILDTRNFSFHALGATEQDARVAMQRGWALHCRQHGMTNNWGDFKDGVNVFPLAIGQTIRDGELLN